VVATAGRCVAADADGERNSPTPFAQTRDEEPSATLGQGHVKAFIKAQNMGAGGISSERERGSRKPLYERTERWLGQERQELSFRRMCMR
jgi:hypothetical protein